MAINISTDTVVKDLEVTSKYEQLLGTLLCDTSVYIRTKETLAELVSAGDLKGADKAKVISEVLTNLNNGLVNAALQTALSWAAKEEEIEIERLKLGAELALADNNIKTAEANTYKVKAEIAAMDSQSRRLYGTPTVDINGRVTSLGNDGKVWKEMTLLDQQLLNAQAEEDVLQSKLKESQASVYKIVADTAANFGSASYTLSDSGVQASVNLAQGTLAYEQMMIARQQANGYKYNAWANGVNAAATTVGLLVSESMFEGTGENLLTKMEDGLTKLLGAGTTT
jgi:hypothetical protein